MQTLLAALLALAMLATLGVLVAGLIGMARAVDGGTAQRLMRYRVLAQLIALALFAALLLVLR